MQQRINTYVAIFSESRYILHMEMSKDEFGEILKRLRLSKAELARRVGVNRTTASRWGNGFQPIPGPVIAYLKLLKYIRDRDGDMP